MDCRLLTSDSGVLLILKLHKRSVMVFGMQEMTPESADGLEVARQTIKNHFDKIVQPYEHGARIERIGRYVKGWWQWVSRTGNYRGIPPPGLRIHVGSMSSESRTLYIKTSPASPAPNV